MFKKITLGALSGLLLAGLASGCTKSIQQKPDSILHTINVASIVTAKNLAPAEKAEQLAKAAEQLLTVQGFAYASDVADLALEQDPSNLRAKFVNAVLAPILAQRGILARIAPFVASDPGLQDQYDKMLADLDTKSPNSTLKTFLLDGTPDITSESDIQGYLDSVADGFETLRQFAKTNKDQTLTVLTSDSMYNAMLKRWEDACVVVETDPWTYKYDCPSQVHLMEVSFNRADFEGVQQLAAGYELYLSLYNSYNTEGAVRVALNHQNDKTPASPQKIVDELLKDPKFATLRANNGFSKIKDMGADAVSAIRWVMNNQNSLCPFGATNARNRLGALFNQGICFDQDSAADVAKGLRKADSALAGGTIQLSLIDPNGVPYKSELKPAALMDAPIADLRSLTPLSFNQCNSLSAVADGTVGGLFPNGDGNKVLLSGNSCPSY